LPPEWVKTKVRFSPEKQEKKEGACAHRRSVAINLGLLPPTIQMPANEPIDPTNRAAEFWCQVKGAFPSRIAPTDLPVTFHLVGNDSPKPQGGLFRVTPILYGLQDRYQWVA
jgi:hypothetical protein